MANQLVFIENNRAVTDSLTVAEVFGKNHNHVLRDIEQQIEKLNEAGEGEWGVSNFGQTHYQHQQNKQRYPKYNLTEEAFTIVDMSYTTPEAMKMKVKFIQEFKRMRIQLQNQQQPTLVPVENYEKTKALQDIDQTTKLLQHLRLGIKDNLFTEATSMAIRTQIAETMLGRPLPKQQAIVEKTSRGRGVKEIADSLGVSTQKLNWIVKKHDLQTEENGYFQIRECGRSARTMFLFNEAGEEKLTELLRLSEKNKTA